MMEEVGPMGSRLKSFNPDCRPVLPEDKSRGSVIISLQVAAAWRNLADMIGGEAVAVEVAKVGARFGGLKS